MTLGENIKHLRETQGMSLEDLAEKMGVEPYKVFVWERGTAKPEVTKLMEIADFFGVSLDELMADGAAESTVNTRSTPAPKQNKERKKSTLYNVFIVILSVLAVAAIPAALALIAFSLEGTLDVLWSVLLCCLLPLSCLIFGIVGQCKGYLGLVNIIIGAITLLICLFISAGAGALKQLEPLYDGDVDFIGITEEITGLALSDFENANGFKYNDWDENGLIFDKEIMTNADGSIIYFDYSAVLPDAKEEEFISEIEESGNWLKGIPTQLVGLAPMYQLDYGAEFLMILNEDTGEYNSYPERSGVAHFICLSYDTDDNTLNCVEYEKQINLG